MPTRPTFACTTELESESFIAPTVTTYGTNGFLLESQHHAELWWTTPWNED